MRPTSANVLLAAVLAACGAEAPAPSSTGAAADALIRPGETVTLDALDADGAWGTVTIRRGEETGGYPLDAIDPRSFIVELSFIYRADRQPVGEFGRHDWALATANDRQPVGDLFEPALPPNPEDFDPDRQELGIFPGAVDVTTEPVAATGMLFFELPRDLENEELVLIYRPEGFVEAVPAIPVRVSGPGPDPVPTATPVPTPAPVTYVERPGLPFPVIQHDEADAFFADPDTCTNPDAGYTVTFPESWYTNTAIGATPACSWFSPEFYEVEPGVEVPDEIVIVITVYDGPLGYFNQPEYLMSEPVEIGGFAGTRREQIGVTHESGAYEALLPSYSYFATLSDRPVDGPTMLASTGGDGASDYELHKAVLDRIMASFTIDD
ncbi:MAG TPA: hypothetical protein VMP86_07030 [Candidatus Binatia bacterium]|nr:hypothetical protein [Candidatus Binatia bacterium]